MNRWLCFAARLYPRRWRGRYGVELDAFLDEASLGWKDSWDILRGALEIYSARLN